MNPLVDPCKLCLVRTMCREICNDLFSYIADVIGRVAADPNDDVLDQFNPEQRTLVGHAAEVFRKKMLMKNEGSDDGK